MRAMMVLMVIFLGGCQSAATEYDCYEIIIEIDDTYNA